jgi:hypothetical protein
VHYHRGLVSTVIVGHLAPTECELPHILGPGPTDEPNVRDVAGEDPNLKLNILDIDVTIGAHPGSVANSGAGGLISGEPCIRAEAGRARNSALRPIPVGTQAIGGDTVLR